MLCGLVLQMGHSGDRCDLASTLCKYDLRKGDLFVLSWATVRRVKAGKCLFRASNAWGCVRSIVLLSFVAKGLEIIYMCIWRMFSFISGVVTVWGSV